MKLLHSADWQIGKQFGQFDADDAVLLAEARFAVVERLAVLAVQHGVQAVLVAGDVFDAQGVADKTIHRLFNAMAGYTGHWVLMPGNHDAALAESVWTRAHRLQAVPPQVHLCLAPEPLLLADIGLVVLPAPLTQRITHVDLTEWFAGAQVPAGLRKVGLAHGSVQGLLADGIDASNPIAPGRAQQAGLDYLALGDWHGTRQVDERCWYSGTPETDRFRANASGQALLVTLGQGAAPPQVSTLTTGQYRWQQQQATLAVPSDLDQLVQALAMLGPADVLSLAVAGQTDLAGQRRLQAAIVQARGRARGLLADWSALRLEPTDADLAELQADGYLGEVVAELRAAQAGPGDVTSAGGAAEAGAPTQLARDALALLAGILIERHAPVSEPCAP